MCDKAIWERDFYDKKRIEVYRTSWKIITFFGLVGKVLVSIQAQCQS